MNCFKGHSIEMDLYNKSLPKLLKRIEAFSSDTLLFKPMFHDTKRQMYCFEILVSNKDKKIDNFSIMFFFDCTTSKIYLEDYGTVYTGHKPVTAELKQMFEEAMQLIISFVTEFSDLHFTDFQTTSRITDKFDFLEKVGFERKEQLNHYENFRFIKPLA